MYTVYFDCERQCNVKNEDGLDFVLLSLVVVLATVEEPGNRNCKNVAFKDNQYPNNNRII